MKRRILTLFLAALTVGLLGSCKKINERLDVIDQRVGDIEQEKIASIENQIAAINASIADLGTIRKDILDLQAAVGAKGEDISELQAADKAIVQRLSELQAADAAIEKRIDELKAVVGDLSRYAEKDWATATFATLEQLNATNSELSALKEIVEGLGGIIDEKIAKVKSSLSASISSAIRGVNASISALEDRVSALEEMIQTVTLVPAYSDGSVKAENGVLYLDCVISPASAVRSLTSANFSVLVDKVLTKTVDIETITEIQSLSKNPSTGAVSLRVSIADYLPADGGSLTVALNVTNGKSDYTTKFHYVNHSINQDPVDPEIGDDDTTVKVSLPKDDDFPNSILGTIPVEEAFKEGKETEISVEGIGKITFDADAAEQIKENANGATDILIKVEDVTTTKPVEGADVVLEVTMKTYDENGTEVFSEDNAKKGVVTIEIPLEEDIVYVKTVTLVNDDGEPIVGGVIPESVVLDLTNHILIFQVEHFSKYAVGYVKQKDFVSVEKVTLNKTTMTLTAGGTETLTATITPTDATNKNVTWSSSNTAVATVGNDGKVTAVAAGTATITVTTEDGSKTATCTMTVSNPIVNVTDVSLNKTTMTLTVGGTETLTATITPTDATNRNVTWSSSNTAVATVGTDGKVTAVAAGTATITVTTEDGSKTATCSVTVSNPIVSVTDVSLNKTTMTLTAGGAETLTATITPANATNRRVTWSSSNTAVATVDKDGKVTAVAAGTATITVTTEDVVKATGQPATATCSVTVSNPIVSVTSVSLNKTELTLEVGSDETLTATITPTDATNPRVTWSSSNTAVATVDKDGKVTAVAAGTATITVTTEDGSKTATCTVTVVIGVTGVTLNKTEMTLAVGGYETLTATVAPDNAFNKEKIWTSSKPDVATVDNDGKVTAVAHGTATITVTTEDGGKTATCTVTVTTEVGFGEYGDGGNI